MSEVQKTLVERGLEAWCDTEHDTMLAEELYEGFNNVYFRVKGVKGQYHIPNTERRTTSPPIVTELCEYQHPDIIISLGGNPILSIEITSHKPWGANVVQRIPRIVKACELGVPSIILTPRGKNSSSSWGVKVQSKLMEIYKVPSLSILFKPDEFKEKFALLRKIVHTRIKLALEKSVKVSKSFISLDKQIINDMEKFCNEVYKEKFRQVEIHDEYIKVNIDLTGKKRYSGVKTGWETKGTGLLDPYPGYILTYDFLLCRTGPKITDRKKKIFVHFRNLPRVVKSQKDNPATWWIMQAEKSGRYLYWNLIKKLSNGVIFKGENISDIKSSSLEAR